MIGIGTAQFGLDYGISNRDGQVYYAEAERILSIASELNIRVIDTAALYGDSEGVIGRIIGDDRRFDIVTKTPKTDQERVTANDVDQMVATFHQSLKKLRRDKVYGLLVHDCDDLLKPGGEMLAEAMAELRSDNLVGKIGVSIYSGEQIDRIMRLFTPNIAQVPLSVFDQRLITDGRLARLRAAGVEVHSRSTFLQGLLLMNPESLPVSLDPIGKHLADWKQYLDGVNLTPLQAAIQFVCNHTDIDRVIVGVCSHDELRQIHEASLCAENSYAHPERWAYHDERMLNPARWTENPTKITEGVTA